MDLSNQVDRIVAAARQVDTGDARCLIAIGGPPASGKSTLAEHVQEALRSIGTPCGLVPMDGFHLDNEILKARGLLSRKGAPATFDVGGFLDLITQLTRKQDVTVPLFDRAADRVRQNASRIAAEERFVIIEGNYLFLNSKGWSACFPYWSLKVFVAPPIAVLESRLIQRWIDHGLTREAAEQRARSNDLLNARTVLEGCDRSQIDLVFEGIKAKTGLCTNTLD